MADLTGDGQADLFTACFEGGLYLLAGKGSGQFAAAVPMKDKAGALLRLGQYWNEKKEDWSKLPDAKYRDEHLIAATPVDWDGDGDFDLVQGSAAGRFFLRKNEGTAKAPAFAVESERFDNRNEPITVPGGHCMPVVVDWDRDGQLDLISGSGEGGVHWWRNEGKKGKPRFPHCRQLLAPSSKKPGEPGIRTQVSAADFDDDGDLDLLVGDCHIVEKEGGGDSDWHGYVWVLRRQ
ncbi:MAG: VCBS repeat-containing protein [Planctomycetes bacterium]|nr:VCBS repeat-containing protein [Planctomycetota bacterium]